MNLRPAKPGLLCFAMPYGGWHTSCTDVTVPEPACRERWQWLWGSHVRFHLMNEISSACSRP
jgi:hypothetical protein